MKVQLAKNLFILTNKLRRLLEKEHNKNGMHIGQARVLKYLYGNQDQSIYQKDIEQTFQIRSGTVTGLLDSLSKNGLIMRKESTVDKRRNVISLTKRGIEVAELSIDTYNSFENKIISSLSENELKVFNNVLIKLHDWTEQEELDEKAI